MGKNKFSIFLFLFFFSAKIFGINPENYTYAVIVSQAAYSDAGWKSVADSLVRKHSKNSSKLFIWKNSVSEVKADLAAFMPTYIGFIARPVSECNSAFVATISQLCRALDSDPYGDAYWGVITGFQSSDALRAISESLLVKTVLLGSGGINYEPPIERYYQAIGLPCESYTRTDYMFADVNGKVYTADERPDRQSDRVNILSKWLNAADIDVSVSGKGKISGPVDCLITGGHGNVNVWQMHYSDAGTEGYINSSNGQLYGAPYSGSQIPISCPTPKLYWHVCNCLMATPDNINNWVYAAFHSGHAVQLFGFIPEASSGDEFMAWGMFDRTTKFAGKYTLPQAHFLANNNALFELRHSTGLFNEAGVKAYMDSTLVYGDPAADVNFYSFGDSARVYRDSLTCTTGSDGKTTFEYSVNVLAHDIEFGQGYCYQFRPVVHLPERIDMASVSITKNEGSTAEITDNILIWEMIKKGETLKKGATRKLQWTARYLENTSVNKPVNIAHENAAFHCNASKNGIMVSAGNISGKNLTLSITDMSGRLIIRKHFRSDSRIFEATISADRISAGLYVATLKTANGSVQTTFRIAQPQSRN